MPNKENHWGGFVANSPEELARKAVALYSEPNTWYTASQQGESNTLCKSPLLNLRFVSRYFLVDAKFQRNKGTCFA